MARLLGLGALAVVTFGAATLAVLYVAATTSVGPTLVELSATHGIHLGDVVVGLVSYLCAGIVVMVAADATAPRDH